MKLRELPLLTDENIDQAVIDFLRGEGFDVVESKLAVGAGAADAAVLQFAREQQRLVLTHDRDFGALVFASKKLFYAILYLRPGHLNPAFTIESIRTLLSREIELNPPFIIVCERVGDDITVRIRQPIS